MKPTNDKVPSPILPDIYEDCHPTPSVAHLFRRHYLLQSPMYYLRWFYVVIKSIYLLFVLKPPADSDIVGYVENTTMAMLIRPARIGKPGEFEVTVDDCKLQATGGFKLKNFSLRYKRENEGVYILSFCRNGLEVNDRAQIFSTVFFYHTHSMHTKSHMFSNSLVRYIVDRDMKILEESTYTAIPLHYVMFHSSLSVLQWEGNVSNHLGYSSPGLRESVVEESINMSSLAGHHSGKRWNEHGQDTFAYKLFRSRLSLQSVMERHGIDQRLLDPLFNHTIVHSADHHFSYEWSRVRFSLHPWDTACTTYRAFNAIMLRKLIFQPNFNRLAPNTLRSINKPFYQDLYRELHKIDPEMADVVTASIMS